MRVLILLMAVLIAGCAASSYQSVSLGRKADCYKWVLTKADTTYYNYMNQPAVKIVTLRYVKAFRGKRGD